MVTLLPYYDYVMVIVSGYEYYTFILPHTCQAVIPRWNMISEVLCVMGQVSL
jgi:hypothetical protein